MKNVTITLDERVAHWARIRAAEADTSLSRFLGRILEERMEQEATYETAMRRYLAREARTLKAEGVPYPELGRREP